MMQRAAVALIVVGLLAMASGASAQFTMMTSAANTISVTATGTAEMEADWLEVKLSVDGSGPSAVSALMENQDNRDRSISELLEQGVKAENIKSSAPTIAGGGFAQMVMQQSDDKTFSVTSALTIRIENFEPDTVYEDICNMIDAAATGGAGPGGPSLAGLNPFAQAAGLVTFGVNDEKALREKAISNALDEARALAEITAAKSGSTLGALVGVQIQSAENPMAGWMQMMGTSPAPPDKASESVTLTVSYKLE